MCTVREIQIKLIAQKKVRLFPAIVIRNEFTEKITIWMGPWELYPGGKGGRARQQEGCFYVSLCSSSI